MILALDPLLEQQLNDEHLKYVSDKSPGFFRQKRGSSFDYYDTAGKRIKDPKILDRINALAIPPAWKEVWVGPKINGHLQATGIDDRGRKQYLYHPDWIQLCQENKFAKLADFGLSLPTIRSRIQHDLGLKKMEKRKVLATIVWLLEHTFIRIGNDEYSKENNSYGLTTLRNKHVLVKGSSLTFSFRGKSGVDHIITVNNPKIAQTIKQCVELPGYELFQFIDEDGDKHVIDSADVNLFLKETTRKDFSAKDFRTWGGTAISANHLFKLGEYADEAALKQNLVDTVKKVSSHLHNTVAVCRSYYIHPTVFKSYTDKKLLPHFEQYQKSAKKRGGLDWDELAIIKLLQKY